MPAPEPYDGNGDSDDWLRRALSYRSLADWRQTIIWLDYLEHNNGPAMRDAMAAFYDERQEFMDPYKSADYLLIGEARRQRL